MFIARIVATLAVLAGVFHNVWYAFHSLASSEAAGMQFSNSDVATLTNEAIQSSLNVASGWVDLLAIVLLVLIWWKPVKALLTNQA